MKSLQQQLNLIREGKGSKETFIKSAKLLFPDIPNHYGFEDTVGELKYRNIINENNKQKNEDLNFFKLFESKVIEKKPTKEVVDMETRGFDYKDTSNIDNLFGEQFLKGFYTEMQDPKNEDKSVSEVKSIVAKNLSKDRLFYVKNGQFGVKGVGYTTEHPGLGTPKEAKGKYKSSGYGNLNENKSLKENEDYDFEDYDFEDDIWFNDEDETFPTLSDAIPTDSYFNSREEAIEQAKLMSSQEGVVQHVNELPDGKYTISDWYDAENTIASFESGFQLNENETGHLPQEMINKVVPMYVEQNMEIEDIADMFPEYRDEIIEFLEGYDIGLDYDVM